MTNKEKPLSEKGFITEFGEFDVIKTEHVKEAVEKLKEKICNNIRYDVLIFCNKEEQCEFCKKVDSIFGRFE